MVQKQLCYSRYFTQQHLSILCKRVDSCNCTFVKYFLLFMPVNNICYILFFIKTVQFHNCCRYSIFPRKILLYIEVIYLHRPLFTCKAHLISGLFPDAGKKREVFLANPILVQWVFSFVTIIIHLKMNHMA